MPIDPRIALGYQPTTQLESPANVMAKVYALQGAQQENAMREAQMGEYQRKMQDQNALRATLAGFKPDMTAEQQVAALQRGGHLAEARSLAESSAKVAADKRAEEKAALEAESKRLEIRSQVYGSVAQNPTLEAAHGALTYLVGNKLVDENNAAKVWQQIQANPTSDNIRGMAENFRNMGLAAKDQLDQKWKQTEADWRTGTAAETRRSNLARETETSRHNMATESIQRAKPDAKAEKQTAGQDLFDTQVAALEGAYGRLKTLGGIKSTSNTAAENLGILATTQGAGGMLGRAAGTEVQSKRNEIRSARMLLLQSIKQATGMSAQQLNSNVELAGWLDAVTNPDNDYESNVAILNNIKKFVNKNSDGTAAPELELTAQDAEALAWANANPKDPRADKIKARVRGR